MLKNFKYFLVVFNIFLTLRDVYAYNVFFQHLVMPVGARAIGMGEAFSAIADDAYAIFYNPGGLAFSQEEVFTLSHSDMPWHSGKHQEYYLASVFPIKRGAVSFSINYLPEQENYSHGFEFYSGGAGVSIGEKLGIGTTLKFIHGVGWGCPYLAVEVGGLYKALWERISFGCGVTNITVDDAAATLLYAGIALWLPSEKYHKVIISTDIAVPPRETYRPKEFKEIALQIGAEYQVTKRWIIRVGLVQKGRAGYFGKSKKGSEYCDTDYSGVGAGFGVKFSEKICLDFATKYQQLGHHKYILSLNIKL